MPSTCYVHRYALLRCMTPSSVRSSSRGPAQSSKSLNYSRPPTVQTEASAADSDRHSPRPYTRQLRAAPRQNMHITQYRSGRHAITSERRNRRNPSSIMACVHLTSRRRYNSCRLSCTASGGYGAVSERSHVAAQSIRSAAMRSHRSSKRNVINGCQSVRS